MAHENRPGRSNRQIEGGLHIWRFGRCELDERSRTLLIAGGQSVFLEPKPFDLLVFLLKHQGDVVTYPEILAEVWAGRIVLPETLKNAISKIRAALGEEGASMIETRSKVGYRIAVPIARVALPRVFDGSGNTPAPGFHVPHQIEWVLQERVEIESIVPAWRARNEKTGVHHRFMFCSDGDTLGWFKRQIALDLVLSQADPRFEFHVKIVQWNFERTPYYIESEDWGESLECWIEKNRPLFSDLSQRLKIAAAIADALACVHSSGVLHADIRPSTVCIEQGPLGISVRLCNFGNTDKGLRPASSMIYSAPELLATGLASVRSDIYALGVLAFQLVVGDLSRPLAPGWELGIDDEAIRTDIHFATHSDPNLRMVSAQLLGDGFRALPQRKEQAEEKRQFNRIIAEARDVMAKAEQARARARARRPWIMAASAAIAFGIVVSGYFYIGERREAARSSALNDFILRDMFEPNDASLGVDPGISLHDVLLGALPRVSQRFGDDPVTEANILTDMAASLDGLSDHRSALEVLQRAAPLLSESLGPKSRKLLTTRLMIVLELIVSHRIDDARTLLQQLTPEVGALRDRTYLMKLTADAELAAAEGRFIDEAALWKDILNLATSDQKGLRVHDLDLDTYRAHLMRALLESNNYTEAIAEASQWLPILKQRYGESGSPVRKLLSDLDTARAALAEAHSSHQTQVPVSP